MMRHRLRSLSLAGLLFGSCASIPALAAGAGASAAPGLRWEPIGIPVEGEGGVPFFGGYGSGDRGPRFRFADLDADGDAELYVLDKDGRIAAYRNDGGPTSPAFFPTTEDVLGEPLTNWFLFADIDADADLDLFGGVGPQGEAIAYFQNTGSPGGPRFEYQGAAAFLDSAQIIPRLGNVPSLADLDRDGALDIFYIMPDQGIGAFHRNVGTPTSPWFGSQILDYGGLNTLPSRPIAEKGSRIAEGAHAARHGASITTFLDMDGDGDDDLFVGDIYNANVWHFRNDGPADSAVFTLVSEAALDLPFDSLLVFSIWTEPFDADGDGRSDLVVSPGEEDFTELTSSFFLFRRFGDPDSALFAFTGDTLLAGIDLGARSYPALADLDADGDLDLVLSSLSDAGEAGLVLFENIGSTADPAFRRAPAPNALSLVAHDSLDAPSPTFADMDGDGDLDLLVGAGDFEQQVFYFENVGRRNRRTSSMRARSSIRSSTMSGTAPTTSPRWLSGISTAMAISTSWWASRGSRSRGRRASTGTGTSGSRAARAAAFRSSNG